jgi:hypothetical protein
MRVPAMLLIMAISVPATAADVSATKGASAPAPNCARTNRYLADKSGLYHGAPLAPKKLTELPPATGYMAVYRQVNGCEAPLTMVEYRGTQRR